jgi:peptidoglycan/xylan/chitin deacetylase (PgdA/CDA1 family)
VIASVLGLLPSRIRAGDRLILAYHNVIPSGTAQIGEKTLHMPADQFAEQIAVLRREVDLVPLMDLLTRESTTERRVAITFDDACASALELGVRHCAAQEIPTTVFVAPNLLGTIPWWDEQAAKGRWSEAERRDFLDGQRGITQHSRAPEADVALGLLRIADESELRSVLRLPGITLGNHTMTHANLSRLSPDAVAEEIRAAHAWLMERFPSHTIPVVAYPYGLPPTDQACHRVAGIEHGLLAAGGWLFAENKLPTARVPRWNVPAPLPIGRFTTTIRGPFSRPSKLQEVA